MNGAVKGWLLRLDLDLKLRNSVIVLRPGMLYESGFVSVRVICYASIPTLKHTTLSCCYALECHAINLPRKGDNKLEEVCLLKHTTNTSSYISGLRIRNEEAFKDAASAASDDLSRIPIALKVYGIRSLIFLPSKMLFPITCNTPLIKGGDQSHTLNKATKQPG
ncbi:hypothetical protein QBC46DRAFT_407748 [Diplogelasinospora grovesii]|uniref:Uncharacterized protein n=1 Tax=Diplogelasinospora grovesii TaxID=303347 RepID=A0AAN6NA36_9PEZI|nr:hypothetical protein QBC46DRAFT_407748 [Diplogelasinospora grovesii]